MRMLSRKIAASFQFGSAQDIVQTNLNVLSGCGLDAVLVMNCGQRILHLENERYSPQRKFFLIRICYIFTTDSLGAYLLYELKIVKFPSCLCESLRKAAPSHIYFI